jgi:hypothetical protein
MRHTVANPFPFETPFGDLITDEACACGHSRRRHYDTVAYGHGACAAMDCTCWKFTWVAWETDR